jgi:hypothetical protein
MVSEADKQAGKLLQARVKADLARRGLSDRDISGVDVESDVDTHRGHIDRFYLRVHLTEGRAPLLYAMDNRPGASVTEGGVVIPDPAHQERS